MTGAAFSFSIQKFDSIASTNSLLMDAAKKGAPEGTVYVADHQTAGRGKPGNTWVSPPGSNLLFSLLIRPPIRANEAPILTQISCRSIAEVLNEDYNIATIFKRPNDILIPAKDPSKPEDARKLCGVLTEAVSKGSGELEAVVIGVGLNVNFAGEALPDYATSMQVVLGQTVNRDVLLDKILNQLRKDCDGLYNHPA